MADKLGGHHSWSTAWQGRGGGNSEDFIIIHLHVAGTLSKQPTAWQGRGGGSTEDLIYACMLLERSAKQTTA